MGLSTGPCCSSFFELPNLFGICASHIIVYSSYHCRRFSVYDLLNNSSFTGLLRVIDRSWLHHHRVLVEHRTFPPIRFLFLFEEWGRQPTTRVHGCLRHLFDSDLKRVSSFTLPGQSSLGNILQRIDLFWVLLSPELIHSGLLSLIAQAHTIEKDHEWQYVSHQEEYLLSCGTTGKRYLTTPRGTPLKNPVLWPLSR